jgi:hypothetical protein
VYTDIKRGLLICTLETVEGAINVIVHEFSDDSLFERLQERDGGVFGQTINLDVWVGMIMILLMPKAIIKDNDDLEC